VIPFDPSAARGTLGQSFVRTVMSDFERYGPRRLKRLRRQRPQDYFRLVFALLPKEFRLREVELPDMSDHEFYVVTKTIRTIVAAQKQQAGNGLDPTAKASETERQ